MCYHFKGNVKVQQHNLTKIDSISIQSRNIGADNQSLRILKYFMTMFEIILDFIKDYLLKEGEILIIAPGITRLF